MGATPTNEKARILRIQKGLTQVDVATHLGVSQSHIARLEHGERSLQEEQTYLAKLKKMSAAERGPGGRSRAGRVLKIENCRGQALIENSIIASLLPSGWHLLGASRCDEDCEIAFLLSNDGNTAGFASVHLVKGKPQLGRVVSISPDNDGSVSSAFVAFANGYWSDASEAAIAPSKHPESGISKSKNAFRKGFFGLRFGSDRAK